jgi:hypothetical protein
MASSSKKRTLEEALELLEDIRNVGEETRDNPELLFWCPTCGLPQSRSAGDWKACDNHPDVMVTCGRFHCWKLLGQCRVKADCEHVLCPACACDPIVGVKRCVTCRTKACFAHSRKYQEDDPPQWDRLCDKCSDNKK